MGTIPPPFVLRARPIRVSEFMDAVAETCPPIFGSLFRTPGFRDVGKEELITGFVTSQSADKTSIGIAVSGGVDSMALAYLCSMAKHSVHLRIGDHRPREFRPFVVDHGLREGSHDEAEKVTRELANIGFQTTFSRIKLNWTPTLKHYNVDHPSQLPGVEALARRYRYKSLAKACIGTYITSLLVAHHEDDQYETVLMRLLGGHGPRGLRGIQRAADIPECSNIHRAYRSGFHNDLLTSKELYIMVPTPRQRGALRDTFRELDPAQYQADRRRGGSGEWDMVKDMLHDAHIGPWAKTAPPLETLDLEDGGITVYRPLLGFSKGRLEATCLENGIEWFEDHTNHDPTYATRNAIRHISRNHTLPRALQKPSILALSRRCRAVVEAEESEADRLLQRAVITNFQPNIGTAVVQFPKYGPDTFSAKDRRSQTRRNLRILKRRRIAAIAIRKCFSLVTPRHHIDLTMLQSFADVFFPGLGTAAVDSQRGRPSAIAIADVYCVPLTHTPTLDAEAHGLSDTRWFLSRAPFKTNKKPSSLVGTARFNIWMRGHKMVDFRFLNFDGRFWISVIHRLPTSIAIEPFSPEYAKGFREALDEPNRKKLEAMLKQYAPGKTRFTLPALYLTHIRGHHFRNELSEWGTLFETVKPTNVDLMFNLNQKKGAADHGNLYEAFGRDVGVKEKGAFLTEERALVALPTLGIHVKGLEKLLVYKVRYKNVDLGMLNESGTLGSSEFWARWSSEMAGRKAWHEMLKRKASVWGKRKKSKLREDRKVTRYWEEEEEHTDGEYEGWY
ncbi:hypothetical protein MKZ38_010552 [Zalerion maritima]|uniref:tRNA(Ile)-lysidine synthetase n=1 Tax=Zalerion maritima TaxID=339359 RepID=A0AAD5WM15_9PEZI|nr:hypothetical protein MKZ38_010552 [Zalerion maritima]